MVHRHHELRLIGLGKERTELMFFAIFVCLAFSLLSGFRVIQLVYEDTTRYLISERRLDDGLESIRIGVSNGLSRVHRTRSI